MNVLIADDDPVARLALSRIVKRATTCAVTEADNGLDVLDQLEGGRIDLLVLDLVMPGMDGLEVLQVIRSSPSLRELPVVVVSAINDERGVADAIKLGITDYVTKPLRSERIAARLMRVLRTAPATTDPDRRLRASLEPGKTLMIVDANGDFRQFFGSVMGPRNPVLEVPSGVQALKMCLDSPPSAVFVGPDIGALPPEALVRKLRGAHETIQASLLGAWPKTMLENIRQANLFDEVIARTFVPDVLKGQVEDVYTRSMSDDLEHVLRQLEPRTRSTIEQVFGMMLATDLVAGNGPLPAGPTVVATVDLSRQAGQPLIFRMVMPVDNARAFAARLLLIEDASTEDAISGMKEVAVVIVGRIQQALDESGTSVTCGAPQACVMDLPPSLATQSPTRIVQCFANENGEPLFGVELEAAAVEAAA